MKALATDTPNALRRGYREGRELGLGSGGGSARVVAVGMGASGIVADLARSVVEAETATDLTVVRGFSLPRSVNARTHVLLTSYSGNTWETLRAYEAAGRCGARRTVVSSGGELAERAERDGVPALRVPPGLPPRSAIGSLLGGTLGLLDAHFPESNESRVDRAAENVRGQVGRLAGSSGPAARLAGAIGERAPLFYAEGSYLPLARRWKSQVEENAKRLAFFDEVPELFHNAIVGWDALKGPESARFAVVALEWSGEDPHLRQSFRYLDALLRARRVRTLRAPLPPEDRLEALLYGIVLGDLASLYLARRRKVDPLPVDAITRLKSRLALKSPG